MTTMLLLMALLTGLAIGRLLPRAAPVLRSETLAETICRERNGGTHACARCTAGAGR